MNEEDPNQPVDPKERYLKIRPQQFVDFLNVRAPEARCPYCRNGDFEVSPGPDGKTIGAVATPVPHIQNLGVWLYFATCNNCGFVAFFHSAFVAKQIEES
ncbi:hypothetical protein [Metapseudomonas otitidis]|uniref:Uncharacterized protein n=1 Tax=Metapseudomonas otitidis TaxID=319939 RepID=A0A679GPB7_9GAMM|nr:hypothetical protein [Pseudomonas otitidis]BCA30168.1 hypothetical protein PtoMrB4_41450 [Pseudomonas otitidis]